MKKFTIYALAFEFCAMVVLALISIGAINPTAAYDSGPLNRLLLIDSFSNRLFEGSIRRYAHHGDLELGGFMLAFQKEVHVAAVRYIDRSDGAKPHRDIFPYISHYNLQYAAGKQLTLGSRALIEPALLLLQILCATGMALVVAAIALFAEREFGDTAGAAIVAIFALSPAMLTRALSPYWALFLHFLPLVAALWLYPRMLAGVRLWALALLLGVLTCLKAMTGYEYLSNIVLGPMVAVLYFEIRDRQRFDWGLIKQCVSRGIVLGLGAVAGFAVAAVLHIWKASLMFGSLAKGVLAFTLPLSYSTLQSAAGIREDVGEGPLLLLRRTAVTFSIMNPVVNLPLYGALVLCSLLVLARQRWSPRRLWDALDDRQRALYACVPAAALASLSWFLLAQRHSLVHPHLNWVLAYLPFNVFAVILLVELLRRLRCRGEANEAPSMSGRTFVELRHHVGTAERNVE